MRYFSVCSGIEAASVAWHPLGWSPVGFAEVDRLPSEVLAHHYGSNLPGEPWSHNAPPNFGDMTKFREWPDAAIDVLVGGTPCQSFSVAGLRKGLADPRGNLALVYLALLERYRPEWMVWENVPGVLSSGEGRDFGAFLGGLGQLGYGFAYRVLDAQFVRVDGFGRAVPQRRRRVFVVGHSGDWRRAAAVLFDGASLRVDSAPRRETGQRIAATLTRGAESSGRGGYAGRRQEDDVNIIAMAHGQAGAEISFGHGPTLTCNHEAPIRAHSLRADGFDAGEDGTGRGTPLVPVAFDTTQITSVANRSNPQPGDPCHPLAAGAHAPAIAYDVLGVMATRGAVETDVHSALRARTPGASEASTTTVLAQAFDMRGREGGAQFEGPHDTANIRAASGGSSRSYVAQQWAIRRLTPVECERLQGFPDGYTAITRAGKPAADGPRYKVLGNSMAVNCMRWIGRRIQEAAP